MIPTEKYLSNAKWHYYIVLDYPGIGKVLSVVGSGGLQDCIFCNIEGKRNDTLKKTIYLENRRFLPVQSRQRRVIYVYWHTYSMLKVCGVYVYTFRFPDHCEEMRLPPSRKIYDKVKPYHIAHDNA